MNERFDHIIVGAGPAGCVLANRLSEDPARRVLLIEAGPDYGAESSRWPAELRDPTGLPSESHPWGYLHAGSPEDRPLPLPRGKVVGGSSAINGCVWLRGSARDYDEWAARGNPGWSFADLLPYFRKCERDPLSGSLHGQAGPVPVWRDPLDVTPVDAAWAAAAEALGFPRVADLNGEPGQRPSVGPMPKNIQDGCRMSGAFTYLTPEVRARPNLELLSATHIDRIGFDEGRAIGVIADDGRRLEASEVLLAAGSYGSPAILMRSGIGPAAHLRELGIDVRCDLPGVGECLLDHPLVEDFVEAAVKPEQAPGAASFMPSLVKARSGQCVEEIDLHIYHGQYFDAELGRWKLWCDVSLQRAISPGRVRLTSADPRATLEIDHNHLGDPADLEAACDGVEFARRMLTTEPLAETIDLLSGFPAPWRDRDELRTLVRANARTTFHPSSTCRMGPASDPGAVVDAAGRVHGLDGVRVVDASVIPTSPRANIHYTVVAVAEKLADAVRAGD